MYFHIRNVSYTYQESVQPALENISLTLSPGWTGVVGSNGAGKSTLLKLIAGQISLQQGSLSPKISTSFCAQSTETPPHELEAFAYDYSPSAIKLRYSLEIDDAWLWRFDTLSHGERKRVQLACALALNPRLLALDEPTNHLDGATKALIEKTLASYDGIGLLVSHDRSLLDGLVRTCLFIDEGRVSVIPGTYSQAKQQQDLHLKSVASERRNAQLELTRIRVEEKRRERVASQADTRRSARHLGRHDHDGREKLRLAIYSGQDGKAGKLSSQMNKKMEGAEQRLANAYVKRSYDGSLTLNTQPSHRKVLLSLEEGTLSLGEARVLRYPALSVGPTDRIGFVGRNGTGKSSLLRHFLRSLPTEQGLVYLPQELTQKEGSRLLHEVKNLSPREKGDILSIVAQLNSTPARILDGHTLSPGELRKILIAQGLLSEAQLIVMDEPTNHLDIGSIEALQEVLSRCECALLLVSHDQQFLEQLTTKRWVFKETQLKKGQLGDTTLVVR